VIIGLITSKEVSILVKVTDVKDGTEGETDDNDNAPGSLSPKGLESSSASQKSSKDTLDVIVGFEYVGAVLPPYTPPAEMVAIVNVGAIPSKSASKLENVTAVKEGEVGEMDKTFSAPGSLSPNGLPSSVRLKKSSNDTLVVNDGLEYPGISPLISAFDTLATVTAPTEAALASTLAASEYETVLIDGTTGGTEETDKSEIVGAAPNEGGVGTVGDAQLGTLPVASFANS
jgi:hypothetical protein